MALAQSILIYCIPVWGGAAKTKFIAVERAQRALIKVMYFKNMRYSTETIYSISGLLSVRKLYLLYLVLKKHKSLPYAAGTHNTSKRRSISVAQVPKCKTEFASKHYEVRAAYIYNGINKDLDIYPKNLYENKQTMIKWLSMLNYTETETVLQSNTYAVC